MDGGLLRAIEKKTGVRDLAGLLADRLSGSELSSLMLEVYGQKTGKMKPAELLVQYRCNRLVQPSELEMIGLLESELAVLRFFRDRGFLPVQLSPVTALGCCSVVAAVSQDKIVSAVRNTEIVADATNSLALHVAALRKGSGNPAAGEEVDDGSRGEEVLRLSTVHRHVRTQPFADKRFLPHFTIACMVTAGKDRGSYGFECAGMAEHIAIYVDLLRDFFGVEQFRVLLKRRMGYDERNPLIDKIELSLRQRLEGVVLEREGPERSEGSERGEARARSFDESSPPENAYYKGVQFKLYIIVGGAEWEIADGGFVAWTEPLRGNRKERFLIRGFGLELLFKIQQGLL